MTIYEYVAHKNPIGAKSVLNSFGEKAVPRPDILARQLANAVNKYGKDALFRIASVHPDLELVNEYNKVANPQEECDCKTKELFSSVEGQELKRAVEDLTLKQDTINTTKSAQSEPSTRSDKTEMMILGVVAVIALALITKK
jgi:hypothetical protein